MEHQLQRKRKLVVQFAFRSGSKEDTICLIEALGHSADKAESDEIMVTYRAKYDMKPAWVEQVETCLWHLKCTVSRRRKQSIIWQIFDCLWY